MSLKHFAARHFSGLKHFASLTLAGVTIQVEVLPPIASGGGGRFPVPMRGPGYYSLDPRFLTKTTRHVIITVKLSDDKQWKKHYVVETQRAELIIKAMNWIDSVRSRIKIGIDGVKRVTSKVTALFGKQDK